MSGPDTAYERRGHPLGDLRKTLEIWLRVDPFGPDLKSIRSVNDPRGDVQQVIVPAHCTFKYDLNVKFSGQRTNIHTFRDQWCYGTCGRHANSIDAHQLMNQFIGDDLSARCGQVAARRIHKRQNRYPDSPSLDAKLTRSRIFNGTLAIVAAL